MIENMFQYQKAKTWAQKSGIKSSSEWARKAKENKIPKNIPKAPDSYYKRRGLWETWGIFLGTKIVANQNKKSIIRPFKEALKWVHTQDVKDKNGWKKLCQSKNFPKDIPKTPMNAYPNELKGKGMGYWYGTNKKSTHDIDWRPFKKARKYVQDLEFQNTTEYRKWATTDQKPQDIPSAPKRVYKEFENWEDWLGNKERKQKKYLDYSKAKKWAQSKKIPSGTVWRKLVSQKKIPKNIPGAPDKKYEEWEGWPKFLGTIIEKMTYEEASQFVQSKKIIGDIANSPKIVVDNGGGAAKDFAKNLLKNLGCDVEMINHELLGCSRGPDPTSDELIELSNITNDKEIGFAFDLDGDRLVVVKNGKKQTPDVTLGLGVAKSLELGYKKFVLSLDTSVSIEKFIKEKGGTVVRSKVGEANVIEDMIKNNSQAGGEGSSAGFILPEFNYCREGILTSGLIASMLKNPEFSEIINYMENYFQIREKINVNAKFHNEIIETIKNYLIKKYSEIDTRDGVKAIIDENTWILIRKSNTEDIIRISGESNDKEKCKLIINDITKMVKENYDKIK